MGFDACGFTWMEKPTSEQYMQMKRYVKFSMNFCSDYTWDI